MKQEFADRSRRLIRWTIWTAGAAALAYLIVEHRPHLLGWMLYLVILACPLMHLLTHRRHGGHDGHGEERDPGEPSSRRH